MHRPLSAVLLACVVLGGAAAPARAADRDHDKVFDDLEARMTGDARRPVLVALREPATATRLDRIEQAVGDLGRTGALHIVDAFSASATPAEIRALAARPDVASVQADATVVPFGLSAQQSFGITQARAQLPGLDGNADGDVAYSTGDMVAAVIDSGIDPSMPDLAGKVVGWKDLVNGRDTPYDDLGHGSEVADILAGSGAGDPEGRGVAPGAALVGVKVIDSHAQGTLGRIAEGIQWAVDNRDTYGIDAINLSIGDGKSCGDGKDVASLAVDAAVAAGIVVVTAAGNSGPANCTIASPAAAQSALTVGALADTGAGGFSEPWFSSRGPTFDGRPKPDVSAPGVSVMLASQDGIGPDGTGTSASAPFVAGTALLMRQADPTLTPAQVKDDIMRTAVDWGAPGPDYEYGAGRLDAYAALRAAGAALAVPPAVPGHAEWSGALSQGDVHDEPVDVTSAGFPLAATLNGPAFTSGDFDLTVLDPAGQPVGATAVPFGYLIQGRSEDVTVPAPAPGRYTVRVTAKSGAGPFTVDVSGALAPADGTAPALTLDPPPAASSQAAPTLAGNAGTADGDFPGVVAVIRRDGAVVRRLAATPAQGHWSAAVAPPLPDGAYTVAAEQGDAAGNATHTPEAKFTVDTVAPTVTIATSATTVLLTPSEPVTGYECQVDAVAWRACGPQVEIPAAAPGVHVLAARATDAAGNTGPAAQWSWTVADAVITPPAILPPPVVEPRPCAVALSVPKQRLATVLRRGLTVKVSASPACVVTLTLTRGKSSVRRTLTATTRPARVVLVAPRTLRKRLAHARSAVLTLTASSTGARKVTRRLTLRR